MHWKINNRWNCKAIDKPYKVVHAVTCDGDGKIVDRFYATKHESEHLGSFQTMGDAVRMCEEDEKQCKH